MAEIQPLDGSTVVMALVPPQYPVGQSVELHQCVVGLLHQREEVPEYCHCPGAHRVDLVLSTERGQPDLKQPFHIHLLQVYSDGRVVGSEQLFNAEVLISTSLGY